MYVLSPAENGFSFINLLSFNDNNNLVSLNYLLLYINWHHMDRQQRSSKVTGSPIMFIYNSTEAQFSKFSGSFGGNTFYILYPNILKFTNYRAS